MKYVLCVGPCGGGGHSPHGECGLKSSSDADYFLQYSHSPHGECGLKCMLYAGIGERMGHSPHGECGLK